MLKKLRRNQTTEKEKKIQWLVFFQLISRLKEVSLVYRGRLRDSTEFEKNNLSTKRSFIRTNL